MTALPFLRYERSQLIARQIEAQLARAKLDLPGRFEMGSHLSLMALVARGTGWAITTPLGYMRAARFHDRIDANPLPLKPFARTISLFAARDWAEKVPRELAQTLRQLLRSQVIDPAQVAMPWLDGQLRLIDS